MVLLEKATTNVSDVAVLGELTRGLALAAGRLESNEAAKICSRAARSLTQCLTRTNDPNPMTWLVHGLEPLIPRLVVKEAQPVAAALTAALGKVKDQNLQMMIMRALGAAVDRLEGKEAIAPTTALADALANATDPNIKFQIVQLLAAAAARLEPKQAARLCTPPAAQLVRALDEAVGPRDLMMHAQSLESLAIRLGPTEAAAANGALARALARALATTNDPNDRLQLAMLLVSTATRLEPKEARRVLIEASEPLIWASTRYTNLGSQPRFVNVLVVLAAQPGSKQASAAQDALARALVGTNYTEFPNKLADDLVEASRQGSNEAAAITAVFAQALTVTPNHNSKARRKLAGLLVGAASRAGQQEKDTATAAIAKALETSNSDAYELARDLMVTARRGPKEAVIITAAFVRAVSTVKKDTRYLAEMLSETVHLAPPEAARAACVSAAESFLTRITAEGDMQLMQGLVALIASMRPDDGRQVRAETALLIARQMAGPKKWLHDPASYLSRVAVNLRPAEAKEAANILAEAMKLPENRNKLSDLAQGLAALSDQLEREEAAQICAKASDLLIRHSSTLKSQTSVAAHLEASDAVRTWDRLSKSLDLDRAGSLQRTETRKTFGAILDRLEPVQAASMVFQSVAMSKNPVMRHLFVETLAELVASEAAPEREGTPEVRQTVQLRRCTAVVAFIGGVYGASNPMTVGAIMPLTIQRRKSRFSSIDLVELLKNPLCLGAAREVVLEALAARHRRAFADHWEFVRFAQDQQLGFDFTTPPRRPSTPSVKAP